jgi:hypothetical protein
MIVESMDFVGFSGFIIKFFSFAKMSRGWLNEAINAVRLMLQTHTGEP